MSSIRPTSVASPRAIAGLSDADVAKLRRMLADGFGDRLCAVYVYGSRARGDARDDSDLDLFIVLNDMRGLLSEIDTAIHATYPLRLRLDFPIHTAFASHAAFDRQESLLHREVLSDGIQL